MPPKKAGVRLESLSSFGGIFFFQNSKKNQFFQLIFEKIPKKYESLLTVVNTAYCQPKECPRGENLGCFWRKNPTSFLGP